MIAPQIKSIPKILGAIALVSLAGGVWNANMHGELHSLADWQKAAQDGASYGMVMTCGWICLRSPWAKEVQTIFQGEKTSIDAAGVVTTEKAKVTIESKGNSEL